MAVPVGPATQGEQMTHTTERRRTPRVELVPDESVRLELRHRVQLLDISLTGASLACDTKLPVGTRGHFRASLASVPFTADLMVRRHHVRPAHHRKAGLGALFSSIDEPSRKTLEQFLRRASE